MRTRFLKTDARRPLSWAPTKKLAISAIAALALFTGCLETDKDKACSDPFDKVIAADEIHNKNEAYFNIWDFDFLANPNLKIDSVILQGEVIPHKAARADFE